LSGLHLNVGSGLPKGKYINKEWVNVDMELFDSPNFVQADVLRGLPFPDNSFDSVRAVHVLEHINRNSHDEFLREIVRVLKKGGELSVEVPNFIAVCENMLDGYRIGDLEKVRIWTVSIYGKQRHKGDTHCWGFTVQALIQKMRDTGLEEVKRSLSMISEHYLIEPVILVKGTK